jgi:hypothetical protein
MVEAAEHRSLIQRMIGAALLDVEVYEEVEHDTTATSQAAVVVAIVAVAAAIGGVDAGSSGIFARLISAFIGWLLWSWVTFFIGTRLLKGTADWGEMLRTIGFAQSPGVLYLVGFLPIVGGLVRLGVWVWMLVAVIIAIRQALDFTTGKAIITAGIGWIAYVVFALVVMAIVGLPLAVIS